MSRTRQSRQLGYESLESKCLLAADAAMCMFEVDAFCDTSADLPEVAAEMTCEFQATGPQETPLDLEVLGETSEPEPCMEDAVVTTDEIVENAIDTGNMVEQSFGIATEIGDQVEPAAPIQFDLSDGTDGAFGMLEPDQPSETYSLTAPENGRLDLIIASDLGDADTRIEVTNESGDLLLSSNVGGLDGFQQLGLDVEAGATFEVSISTDTGIGEFQLTAIFEADEINVVDAGDDCAVEIANETDVVVDQVTQISLDQIVGITGELDSIEDVDRYEVAVPNDGELIIAGRETSEGNQEHFEVKVEDVDGQTIAEGTTNDTVQLTADVEGDQEYTVIVSSNGEEAANYDLALDLVETPSNQPEDLHSDCLGDDATQLEVNNGIATTAGALETPEDRDAFQFVASHDGLTEINVEAVSPDSEARLSVSLYDGDGQLLHEAGSNRSFGMDFVATAGQEYQLLVDSTNDRTANYLVSTIARESFLNIDPAAGAIDPSESVEDETTDDSRSSLFDSVDAWFSELGEPLDSLV